MLKYFRIIYVAFTLLQFTSVKAQTIEWSNQQKVKSKANNSQVMGQNTSGIFVIKSRTNEFAKELFIEKYRLNLSLEDEKPLWQPPGTFIEKIFFNEQGLTVIASQKNGTNIELIYWQIDNNLNVMVQPLLMLQEPLQNLDQQSVFYIRTNTVNESYSITYVTKTDNKLTTTLNIASFNRTLQFIFKKQFPLPTALQDIIFTSVEMDNANNIFLLMDFPSKIQPLKKIVNRDFYLYAFYNDEKQLKDFLLSNDTVEIDDWGMAINNITKNITIAGYYKFTSSQKMQGTFLASLDLVSMQLNAPKFVAIKPEFVNKVMGATLNTSPDGLYDVYVRKIIPRSDGGCAIVGERYYESKQTYTYYVNGFPQTSYRIVYNYDEIIYFNLKPDGTVQQQEFFKKKQNSMGDGGYYSSFITMNTGDRIAFIYNADVNAEGDVFISSISPSGETDTRILIKSLSFYVSVLPIESKQITLNTVLCSTLKDRKFSLMRVTF